MEGLTIEQGVSSAFKEMMQKSYDYLTTCDAIIDQCKIIEDLKCDTGGSLNASKTNITEVKNDINSLYKSVLNCEEEMIEKDMSGSNELLNLFDTPPETDDGVKPDVDAPSSGNSDINPSSGGPYYNPPNDNNDYVEPTTPDNTIVEFIPYKFSEDSTIAYQMGDIFINDSISLTRFTNNLLEKYGINNEEVAKKIYDAMLIYGNEYYTKYQTNPVTSQNEEDILSALYEMLKDLSNSPKESFWESLRDVKI